MNVRHALKRQRHVFQGSWSQHSICVLVHERLDLYNSALAALECLKLEPGSFQQSGCVHHPVVWLLKDASNIRHHFLTSRIIVWVVIIHV